MLLQLSLVGLAVFLTDHEAQVGKISNDQETDHGNESLLHYRGTAVFEVTLEAHSVCRSDFMESLLHLSNVAEVWRYD
jgi:hypothetical protein